MGHGNHWECLGGTAEERIKQFIPLTIAKGEVGQSAELVGDWFDSPKRKETINTITYPETPLRCMAMLVSQGSKKKHALLSGFPFAASGGKQRLRILELRNDGNQAEGLLLCETAENNARIGFFDTHYYINQGHYQVGEQYDLQLAGLIYSARCTNEEIIEVTNQTTLAERYAALGETPERLPDGTLPPYIFRYANMTGLGPTAKYPDDAEFYAVIGEVTEFDLEGIRIFQIIPKFEEPSCEEVPLPRVIFGAAAVFQDGYVPKVGDSIGGMLWVQGFLDEPLAKRLA